MNKTKQFWSLLKFQGTQNPFIWIMPFVLGLPSLLFMRGFESVHFGFSTLLPVQNLFFVGILATMVVAPERFQYGATNTAWNSGTEYLLTRAVDRSIFYRARIAFLYLIILLFPLLAILSSLRNPELLVSDNSSSVQVQCLASIPGSVLKPDPAYPRETSLKVISIPNGRVLVEEWHAWMFVASLVWVQALILFLYARRFRTFIYYALVLSSFIGPLVLDLYRATSNKVSSMDQAFFFFASHQAIIWILTAAVLILCQRRFERWFARLEQ